MEIIRTSRSGQALAEAAGGRQDLVRERRAAGGARQRHAADAGDQYPDRALARRATTAGQVGGTLLERGHEPPERVGVGLSLAAPGARRFRDRDRQRA